MNREAEKQAEQLYNKFYFAIPNNGYCNKGFWSINNVAYFALILAINQCKNEIEKCNINSENYWKEVLTVLQQHETNFKSQTNY